MSPKLCQPAVETSSTTAHNGPGERVRLGRTNTRPRGLDSKKCGRRPMDIFNKSGAGRSNWPRGKSNPQPIKKPPPASLSILPTLQKITIL
jgi:hypothetical protein